MKRFVLFASQRTGSNWLLSAMNAHPEITCHSALLRQDEWSPSEVNNIAKRMPAEFHSAQYRRQHYRETLEAIFKASPDTRYVGLKFMYDKTTEILEHLASSDNYLKIILRRDNQLATYASNLHAIETGQGFAKAGEKIRSASVTFDADEFTRWRARRDRLYSEFKQLLKGPSVEVEYCSLRSGAGMASIGAFLDVDPSGFNFKHTAKRGSDDIVSRFNNPAAVTSYLQEHGLAHWATELPKKETA